MKTWLLLLLIGPLLLVGCAGAGATYPPGWDKASAEQITALSKIKDSGVFCSAGTYAGATVTVVTVNADKGVPSGITVEPTCRVSFDAGAGSKAAGGAAVNVPVKVTPVSP